MLINFTSLHSKSETRRKHQLKQKIKSYVCLNPSHTIASFVKKVLVLVFFSVILCLGLQDKISIRWTWLRLGGSREAKMEIPWDRNKCENYFPFACAWLIEWFSFLNSETTFQAAVTAHKHQQRRRVAKSASFCLCSSNLNWLTNFKRQFERAVVFFRRYQNHVSERVLAINRIDCSTHVITGHEC